MVRRGRQTADSAAAKPAKSDVLFLLDTYDASTILQMAEQQKNYVATLTANAATKEKMTPQLDQEWDPASDEFHVKVAEALAATNSCYADMSDEQVTECTKRPRLEIQARRLKIDTSEMQAGLGRIKRAILGKDTTADSDQPGALQSVLTAQAETQKLVQQLLQNKEEKNKAEDYDHYGGKVGGALGMAIAPHLASPPA